jgi:hypothetical protein
MIKLKPLIFEYKPRSTAIGADDMRKLLKTSHRRSAELFQQNKRVYRAVNAPWDALYVDPRSQRRFSKETNNLYGALMDSFKSWDGFPERSFSVMAGTSRLVAEQVEDTDIYYCFFRNDAIFGVSRGEDLWYSFRYVNNRLSTDSLTDLMGSMTSGLSRCYKVGTGYDLGVSEYDNYYTEENIDQYFSVLQRALDRDTLVELSDLSPDDIGGYYASFTSMMIDDMIDHEAWDSYQKYFEDLLSPTKNGFKISDLDTLPYGRDKEVWSSEPAVLIGEDVMDSLDMEKLLK